MGVRSRRARVQTVEGERRGPVRFENMNLGCGFRLDLLVEERAIVEIKAVDQLLPVHESQLLTYLKLTGTPLGLLINFNVAHLRNGIRRRVLTRM
jgi:GxxExxY protein